MKINLVIFVSSITSQQGHVMMKTFESHFRPVKGDIIDDPGFHPDFHNGYEVVNVTVNYAANECIVSLKPLVLDKEEITLETYLEHLKANGWREVTKDEVKS
ncbi:hypothetical protein EDD68_1095 [Melghiribacillus thermohalophilus]|uniref:Uncharacterized protein n=1 Tax=Melghiribacillus thermohalophilus TaxID=1324956 RepID=A0A4R3N696_9BACI|nr:hypothetical protein [Melghiribacillus thermohalophilus]TCT22359.1 hypothetical protein EDD68_1095 [Melghiribacillus thermohalophilus]